MTSHNQKTESTYECLHYEMSCLVCEAKRWNVKSWEDRAAIYILHMSYHGLTSPVYQDVIMHSHDTQHQVLIWNKLFSPSKTCLVCNVFRNITNLRWSSDQSSLLITPKKNCLKMQVTLKSACAPKIQPILFSPFFETNGSIPLPTNSYSSTEPN